MQELVDVIRAAIATDASKEQKAAGVQACRTIAAALDTEPGKPIVLPGTPPKPPLSRVSLDQVLDLLIGRLTSIANAHDARMPNVTAPRDTVALPDPSRPGLRVPAPLVVPTNVTRHANVARPANSARPANVARPANAARATRPAMVARQTPTTTARKP